MPKRISSKVSSYIKPRQGQNTGQENSQPGEDMVIADMAKGFLQTQAKLDNSQEVVDLLHKINGQLENLQGALNGNSHSGGSSYSSPQQEQQPRGINQSMRQAQPPQAGQQAANSQTEVAPELRQLFSMLLANAGQQNNPAAGGGGEQGGQQAKQSQNQSKEQGNGGNDNSSNKPIAVQTAAQVLSQAQYELSNELEASLKKLKQVISESEKIANKISNLLGEENSQ